MIFQPIHMGWDIWERWHMRLNLASGQRPFKADWVNIDIKEQGYPLDIVTDIKDLRMIPDESVEVAVLHHVVEHIAIHDLEQYIGEWLRVLKVGGRLAVFVPNLKELDKAWVEGRITTFIHNVNTYGAYQSGVEDLHKWGYDYQELIDRMSGQDQEGNRKFNWSIIQPITQDTLSNPVYKDADIAMDWWILAVEFTK